MLLKRTDCKQEGQRKTTDKLHRELEKMYGRSEFRRDSNKTKFIKSQKEQEIVERYDRKCPERMFQIEEYLCGQNLAHLFIFNKTLSNFRKCEDTFIIFIFTYRTKL